MHTLLRRGIPTCDPDTYCPDLLTAGVHRMFLEVIPFEQATHACASITRWRVLAAWCFACFMAGVAASEEPPRAPRVADEIRKSIPTLDSDLVKSLRESRMQRISSTWSDSGFEVDKAGSIPERRWSGNAGYGTPLFLSERTVAIIEERRGVEFALWHLDPTTAAIQFITAVNEGQGGKAANKYDDVTLHRVGDDVLAEFARIYVEPRGAKFDGESLIGEINLRTGKLSGSTDRIRQLASEDTLRSRLLKKRRSQDTALDFLTPAEARAKLDAVLNEHGLTFNYRSGRFSLAADTVDSLSRVTSGITLSADGVVEDVRSLRERVQHFATCPALRELDWHLSLCAAVLRNDRPALTDLMATRSLGDGIGDERLAALRNIAAYQLLCLIAKDSDEAAEYQRFIGQCDETIAARDAAILRLHEIGFRAACSKATVKAFDEFVQWAPGAIQTPKAIRYADELESERISLELSTASDRDTTLSQIANRLYVDWRTAVRVQHSTKAERCFRLLTDHPDLRATAMAVQAQDTQDEQEFRNLVVRQNREHTQVLRHVAAVQEQQLAIMGEHLYEQRATNSALGQVLDEQRATTLLLGKVDSQLENVQGGLSYLNESSSRTASGVEAIKDILEK